MTLSRRLALLAPVLAASPLIAAAGRKATAQDYPDGTIRIVAPGPAGSRAICARAGWPRRLPRPGAGPLGHRRQQAGRRRQHRHGGRRAQRAGRSDLGHRRQRHAAARTRTCTSGRATMRAPISRR